MLVQDRCIEGFCRLTIVFRDRLEFALFWWDLGRFDTKLKLC